MAASSSSAAADMPVDYIGLSVLLRDHAEQIKTLQDRTVNSNAMERCRRELQWFDAEPLLPGDQDSPGLRASGKHVLFLPAEAAACRPFVHEASGIVAIGAVQKPGHCIVFWDPSRAGEVVDNSSDGREVARFEDIPLELLAGSPHPEELPISPGHLLAAQRGGAVLVHAPVKSARGAVFMEGNWWDSSIPPRVPDAVALACVEHDGEKICQYDIAVDFSSCKKRSENDHGELFADLHYPQAMSSTINPRTGKPVLAICDGCNCRFTVIDPQNGDVLVQTDSELGWTWGVAINHRNYTAVVLCDRGAAEFDLETGKRLRKIAGPKGFYGCGAWIDSAQNLLWHDKGTTMTVSSLLSEKKTYKIEKEVQLPVVATLEIGHQVAGMCVDEQRGRVIVACTDGYVLCLGGASPMVKSAGRR